MHNFFAEPSIDQPAAARSASHLACGRLSRIYLVKKAISFTVGLLLAALVLLQSQSQSQSQPEPWRNEAAVAADDLILDVIRGR